MGGVGSDVAQGLTCDLLVARHGRQEQNGATTHKCGQIDPVEGLKPLDGLHPVPTPLPTHVAQGIETKLGRIHPFILPL